MWVKELRKHLLQHPLFGYFDYEYESSLSCFYLDFVLTLIGERELSKYLEINISGRAYFCPSCKNGLDQFEVSDSKWAFLTPNSPISTKVECANCNEQFEVIRKKCEDCVGNVICNDKCLTCFNEQSNND